ncbi:alpha/beta hydrolase [Chitinophaga barathri]|uniref:Phospholipase n=1 Tax=Chitinophaga barathri TaxID=1647451 RepID=A0A3N4MLE7_9BACT|nr:dienelactone hydrolase family protein [Chitinophaga barathri]RPD40880.1 phospholipase [Chitinophaga barathri]
MHQKKIFTGGKKLSEANQALVLIHGRGGSAEDILTLADHLHVKDFALVAPEASGNTWYPHSFMAPPLQNEPWLSSAIAVLEEVVNDIVAEGIAREHIFFTGFSQGACLTLEFITRNAARYGGVAAFTGGLIGDRIYPENYKGSFEQTPVFIASGDPDMHVPVKRVEETVAIVDSMGAKVTLKLYPGRPHTIGLDELALANRVVFNTAS